MTDATTTPAPIRIGLNLPTWPLREGGYASWPDMRRLAQAMEAMGVDTLWVPDHLQRVTPGRGGSASGSAGRSSSPRPRRRPDRVGPFIACTGFRNPALLAKMAVTLDEVSGGRLLLGLGSGVPARDASGARSATTARGTSASTARPWRSSSRLVRGETLTFEGEHYRHERGPDHPARPATRRLPVMVAGLGEKTAQVAARHADLISVNKVIAGEEDARAAIAIARARAKPSAATRRPSS